MKVSHIPKVVTNGLVIPVESRHRTPQGMHCLIREDKQQEGTIKTQQDSREHEINGHVRLTIYIGFVSYQTSLKPKDSPKLIHQKRHQDTNNNQQMTRKGTGMSRISDEIPGKYYFSP